MLAVGKRKLGFMGKGTSFVYVLVTAVCFLFPFSFFFFLILEYNRFEIFEFYGKISNESTGTFQRFIPRRLEYDFRTKRFSTGFDRLLKSNRVLSSNN